MSVRTDLVSERREMHTEDIGGVECKSEDFDFVSVETVEIKTEQAAKILQKGIGRYVTLSFPSIDAIVFDDKLHNALLSALNTVITSPKKNIMIVGLGNRQITPDALGPLVADKIFATRHIDNRLKKQLGLGDFSSVSVVKTGVLGKTGIESADTVMAQCRLVNPDLIIAVDALAARRPERLCRTIQISNTGIVSGSGVGNARHAIDEKTLGVPVVAIGVPTVIDASTYRFDCDGGQESESLFVTPNNIDRLLEILSTVLSEAINCALHPDLERETIKMLV